jgi:hypothetical protein
MSLMPQQLTPGVGSQIQFKPNSKITLNHSTYFGEAAVLDSSQTRFFQNLYAQILLKDKWTLQCQADYGMQETGKTGFDKHWVTGFIGMAYKVNEKLSLVGRGELFRDTNNLVIAGVNNDLWGYSFNINYLLEEHLLLRAEWRNITSNSYSFAFKNFNEKQMNGLNLSLAAQF